MCKIAILNKAIKKPKKINSSSKRRVILQSAVKFHRMEMILHLDQLLEHSISSSRCYLSNLFSYLVKADLIHKNFCL